MGNVAEWVGLYHVKHGVNHFCFKQDADQKLAIDNLVHSCEKSLQQLHCADPVHSNLQNLLVGLVFVAGFSGLAGPQDQKAVVGHISEESRKLSLNLTLSFV